jgi:hypothetical protein
LLPNQHRPDGFEEIEVLALILVMRLRVGMMLRNEGAVRCEEMSQVASEAQTPYHEISLVIQHVVAKFSKRCALSGHLC